MDGPNALVEVQVLVPRERLPEFYERHARWLREGTERVPSPWEPLDETTSRVIADVGIEPGIEARDPEEQRLWSERPWDGVRDPSDIADALLIYDRLSAGAKKIFDTLLDREGQDVSGESLAKELGVSQAQLTGTLASIGIRSKAVRRAVPFHYESGMDGGRYWVEPEIAGLFNWARSQPSDTVELASKYDDYRRRYWDMDDTFTQLMARSKTYQGMEFAFEGHVALGAEETAYELERIYRQAMNQPAPEVPTLLQYLRGTLREVVSEKTEGGANGKR
jgi:hypothetical protein